MSDLIDLTPLAKAASHLRSALVEQAAEPERLLLRAGLIQTFEYTFELSHKIIRRYLAATEPSPDAVAELTFEGFEQDFILIQAGMPVAQAVNA